MAAGELRWGQVPTDTALEPPVAVGALPAQLRRCRRVVAVTVHLPEFLLAASGLVQRLGAAGVRTDLLVAAAGPDEPVAEQPDKPADEQADEPAEDVIAAALGELRVPELARHRLALPAPIGADRADDLLAGLSELVGFDPEPGVYCLAPAGDGVDPSQAIVGEAARRIARIYRLPLVRYTATPDTTAVELDLGGQEWARKCAALAACDTQVTPLRGEREYFGV
jgi:hypothetical protein